MGMKSATAIEPLLLLVCVASIDAPAVSAGDLNGRPHAFASAESGSVYLGLPQPTGTTAVARETITLASFEHGDQPDIVHERPMFWSVNDVPGNPPDGDFTFIAGSAGNQGESLCSACDEVNDPNWLLRLDLVLPFIDDDSADPAFRFHLRRRLPHGHGIELGYQFIRDSWLVDPGSYYVSECKCQIDDLQLNYRWPIDTSAFIQGSHFRLQLSMLAGLRYLRLNRQQEFTHRNWRWQQTDSFPGLQMGGELTCLWGRRWRVSVFSNFGLMLPIEEQWELVGPLIDPPPRQDDFGIADLHEAGVTCTFQITDHLAARGGYQWMALDMPHYRPTHFHGPFMGLELRWGD